MTCAYTSSVVSVTKEMLQFEHSGEHTLSNPRSGTIGLKALTYKDGLLWLRELYWVIYL